MEDPVIINGPAGALEGRLHLPPNATSKIVFSHPHPDFGGDMDTPTVRLTCHHLNRLGHATLRYNFRGVGGSAGTYDRGKGERDDLKAAVRFMEEVSPLPPLIVMGYSFGSWVSWRAIGEIETAEKLALISPPFGVRGFRYEPRVRTLPTLALIGELDQFCNPETFHQHMRVLAPEAEREVLGGVDHFWLGSEKRLAERLDAFIKREDR